MYLVYSILCLNLELIYTGKQRLAKSCLLNALLMCCVSPLSGGIHTRLSESAVSIVDIIQSEFDSTGTGTDAGISVHVGEDMDESKYHDLIDRVGATLSEYWELKRQMAAGSEPSFISKMFHSLCDDGNNRMYKSICSGYGLCGAGGGGFAVVILNRHSTRKDLTDRLDLSLFDVIDVEVDRDGICVELESF